MDFRKSLGSYAQEMGEQYHILPSFIMGVAWLESGAGKSSLSTKANNLFSIKGDYKGSFILLPTTEYYNGRKTTVNAKFRKYPSYRESLIDFCNLIKNGVSWNHNVYSSAVIGKNNIVEVVNAFGQTPYMTDPKYSSKLLSVIKSYQLTEYDEKTTIPVTKPDRSDLHTETSLVDYMKAKGMDSHFANRLDLAKKYGIKAYTGTASQNKIIMRKLKEDKGE